MQVFQLIEITDGKVSLEELDLTVKDREISSHHHHHHGIKSMTYTFTGPIDRQLFYQFIMKLPDCFTFERLCVI